MTGFVDRVDLAARSLGGAVMAASDEWFAEKENLLKPEPAAHDPHAFGPRGKVYDGWETRRRREPGHDWAIIRLGVPGIVRSVVVDTAFFRGNSPEEVSVEACGLEGTPAVAALLADGVAWETVVPRSPVGGDTQNIFEVDLERRFTHLRLSMYPDGGIARFRAYGEVIPDPRYLAGAPFDLLAQENGGLAIRGIWARVGRTGGAVVRATIGCCSSSPRPASRSAPRSTRCSSSAMRRRKRHCAAAMRPPRRSTTRTPGSTSCPNRR